MPAQAAHRRRYSVAEYVRLEAHSNVKHEYFDGAIYAMAGRTPEQGALAAAVITELSNQLRDNPCRVYSSDARIRIQATGLLTYPDVSVISGGEQRDEEAPLALTNPIALIEVLSPSTEDYDRGEKIEHYKQIPELRAIAMLAHDRRQIEVWRRDGKHWQRAVAGEGQRAALDGISCTLDVDEIYRDPFST